MIPGQPDIVCGRRFGTSDPRYRLLTHSGVFTLTNSASVWEAPAPKFPQPDFWVLEGLWEGLDSRRIGIRKRVALLRTCRRFHSLGIGNPRNLAVIDLIFAPL